MSDFFLNCTEIGQKYMLSFDIIPKSTTQQEFLPLIGTSDCARKPNC